MADSGRRRSPEPSPGRSTSATPAPETVTIELRGNDKAATKNGAGDNLPTVEGHLYADADGRYPADLNDWETQVMTTVADLDRWTERHSDELRAGQASLHADLLLHGSEPNRSDRRRAGLTIRYAAADVRLIEGYENWRNTSVHVLDGDPSGFWKDQPRPDGEHPELMAEFFGEFDGQPLDADDEQPSTPRPPQRWAARNGLIRPSSGDHPPVERTYRPRVAWASDSSGTFGVRSACRRPLASWYVSVSWVQQAPERPSQSCTAAHNAV